MRIGHLFLQPMRGGESTTARLGETIAITRALEEYGFDVAVFAETHFADRAVSPNPLLLAASVGQHTERIDLATGVIVLGLWHPVRLAEDIAVVDHLLAGRLEVCVGYGSDEIAFDGLGVPYDERRSRHAEALEILLLAWSGEPFDYHGSHYRIPHPIRVLPDPYTAPHPRLRLSASSEPSIRAAAATDLSVFGHQATATGATGRRSAAHDIYRDERRRLGRAGDHWSNAINRRLVVVDSASRSHPGDHGDNVVVGTPGEVLERVRRLRDDLGIDEINFVTEFGAVPPDEARRTIELFGAEVLPALRSDEHPGQ